MAKTITHNEDNTSSFWGDKDHLEVAQQTSFVTMIYELLTEKAPSKEQLEIFELILKLSIDHGPDTPSAVPTIAAAQAGKSLTESLAEGLLQINDHHGGAVGPCMEFLYKIKSEELDVKQTITEYLAEKKLIGGFGHRIYTIDPRTQLIFQKLTDLGFDSTFIELATQIQVELSEQKGRVLPINIDGAIAVALCTWGWEPKLANAVFVIARVPGLCGHFLNNA